MKRFCMRACLALAFVFLYSPILVLIVLSFNDSRVRSSWGGFTLKWYAQLFSDATLLTALKNTLSIALISAAVASLIALTAALGVDAMRKKHAVVVVQLGNIPVLNADIVTGIILMLTMSRFMKLGYVSILIAHITFNIPYVFLSVLPAIKNCNRSVYEAARDLGADAFTAFVRVLLPDIMPSLIGGFFMAVTLSMDDFVVTYFTRGAGIDTLSTLIYGQLKRGIKPEMYALSSMIFLVVFLILAAGNLIPGGSKRRDDDAVWKRI